METRWTRASYAGAARRRLVVGCGLCSPLLLGTAAVAAAGDRSTKTLAGRRCRLAAGLHRQVDRGGLEEGGRQTGEAGVRR